MNRFLASSAAIFLTAIIICPTAGFGANRADLNLPASLSKLKHLTGNGSYSEASGLANALLARYKDQADVHLAAARLFWQMGLVSQAIEEYKQSLALDGRLVEPLVALSELELESLHLYESLRYARLAVQNNPQSSAARLCLVAALLAGDRLTEADKEIAPLLRQHPDNANVLYLAYRLKRKHGDLLSARPYLEGALKTERSGRPQWLYELAELCDTMGDYAGSIHTLETLLKMQPDSLRARAKLASVLEFSCRDYPRAIAQYAAILDIDPESVTAIAGIDRCLAKDNDLAYQLKVLLHHWLSGPMEHLLPFGLGSSGAPSAVR